MQSIGEALRIAQETGYGRRTGSKVWANSKTEVGQEGRLWQPFNRLDKSKIMRVAEKYDRLAVAARNDDRPEPQ